MSPSRRLPPGLSLRLAWFRQLKALMMRLLTIATLFAGAVCLTACASSPAAAQRSSSTDDRLKRIERSLSDLQAAVYRDGDGPGVLLAEPVSGDATVRISQLEREIQILTGRIEELSYDLDKANASIKSMQSALSLGAPTSSPGGPVPLAGPVQPGDLVTNGQAIEGLQTVPGETGSVTAPNVSDVELPLDPDAAFAYASGFLLSGDYARAEAAFALYLKSFPNHPRAADARFRLGEIFLATEKNADAADSFITHIRTYPSDPRAAEAHLKLGTAFSRLGQPDEACKIFRALKSKFPDASPAVSQRAEREMAAINCR